MNILTFDIEEWFHLLDNSSTKTQYEWKKYPTRIHKNMDLIFDLLDKHNVKATFFCLGWLANKHPEVIKSIVQRGFDIGSHTYSHQLIYTQNRNEFNQDVVKSIKVLEDLTGKKITKFRAPGFSLNEKTKWAFEVLYELGIQIDASIFPAKRAHGGMQLHSISTPTIIRYNGVTLKEMPMNIHKTFLKPVVFSGGGYFRLTPYSIIKYFSSKSKYIMTYFHPRDFDLYQPRIKELSIMRRFKSYVGIKGAYDKLSTWLKNYKFIDIEDANMMIDWNKVKIINL